MSEPVWIDGGESGPGLEGRLHRPSGPSRGVAVVCHPHPMYGGTMDNSVVFALADELSAAGWTALRFNFRGVGASGGCSEGGEAERRDVEAALDHLAAAAGPGQETVVAGYSFGAWAAYPVACARGGVSAALCVAPPLDGMPLQGAPACPVPKWFAVADHDPYCSASTFESWFGAQAEPKARTVIACADHFFVGREREVARRAVEFLRSLRAPRGA